MTNPSAPPTLPDAVFSVGRPNVLVTGGTSELGRAIVEELNASLVPSTGFVDGVAAPPAARTYLGDLRTGAGLDAALCDVGAVVHVASATSGKNGSLSTRALFDALAAWAPQAHAILVSSIGAWENPHPYFREQAASENIALRHQGRVSIVRTTPTHDALYSLMRGRLGMFTAATENVVVSPVDPAWVARKLVDVALMRHPLAEPMELAGPEELTLREVSTLMDHISGRRRRLALAMPTGRRNLAAFASPVHLPTPAAAIGGCTFSEWVAAHQ